MWSINPGVHTQFLPMDGSTWYRCCTPNCSSSSCTTCGGPSGVVCDMCSNHYCQQCWLARCADAFPCASLCDACVRALADDKRVFVVSFEPLVTGFVKPAAPAMIFTGACLLRMFKVTEACRMRVLAAYPDQ